MAIFEALSRDGGATFSPRVRVDTSETGASHPRIAVTAGTRAVVWDEEAAGGRRAMIRLGDGPERLLAEGELPGSKLSRAGVRCSVEHRRTRPV